MGDSLSLFLCSSMNEVVHTSPTIGSNVEEIVVNNTRFLMWDIGGQESLRSSWNTYYTNTEVRGLPLLCFGGILTPLGLQVSPRCLCGRFLCSGSSKTCLAAPKFSSKTLAALSHQLITSLDTPKSLQNSLEVQLQYTHICIKIYICI